MELLLFPVDQLQAFLISTARIFGFLSAIPVIFSAQAPAQVRVGLIFILSLLFFPIVQPNIPEIPFQPLPFLIFLIAELLLGAMIGLISRFILAAVQLGGFIIGFQMGFMMANVVDPQSGQNTSLMAQFQNVFAILIFLAIDGHHLFILAAVRSYELLPPGFFNISGEAVPYLVELSTRIFSLGVQFSAPIIVILLLSALCIGLLGRISPQLNLLMLSFPINIAISLFFIGFTLNMMVAILKREFVDIPNRIYTLLQFLN